MPAGRSISIDSWRSSWLPTKLLFPLYFFCLGRPDKSSAVIIHRLRWFNIKRDVFKALTESLAAVCLTGEICQQVDSAVWESHDFRAGDISQSKCCLGVQSVQLLDGLWKVLFPGSIWDESCRLYWSSYLLLLPPSELVISLTLRDSSLSPGWHRFGSDVQISQIYPTYGGDTLAFPSLITARQTYVVLPEL